MYVGLRCVLVEVKMEYKCFAGMYTAFQIIVDEVYFRLNGRRDCR